MRDRSLSLTQSGTVGRDLPLCLHFLAVQIPENSRCQNIVRTGFLLIDHLLSCVIVINICWRIELFVRDNESKPGRRDSIHGAQLRQVLSVMQPGYRCCLRQNRQSEMHVKSIVQENEEFLAYLENRFGENRKLHVDICSSKTSWSVTNSIRRIRFNSPE